jgi:hypothetical protein
MLLPFFLGVSGCLVALRRREHGRGCSLKVIHYGCLGRVLWEIEASKNGKFEKGYAEQRMQRLGSLGVLGVI